MDLVAVAVEVLAAVGDAVVHVAEDAAEVALKLNERNLHTIRVPPERRFLLVWYGKQRG